MNTKGGDIVNELIAPAPIRRKGAGGPSLIVPEDETSPQPYARYSQLVNDIADLFHIHNVWNPSRIVDGFVAQPDLLERWKTASYKERFGLLTAAKRAGGGWTKADRGTAFHEIAEHTLNGNRVDVPTEFQPALDALVTALADCRLEVVATERFVVDDEYRLAGTLDMIVRDEHGTHRIGDIKTGSKVDDLVRMQLYGYARAPHYFTQGHALDGSEDVREPKPECDLSLGYVFHVDIDTGTCKVLPVDLTDGPELFDLWVAIGAARITPAIGPALNGPKAAKAKVDAVFGDTVEVSVVDDAWRGEIRARLEVIRDAGHLSEVRWPVDIPTLKSGDPITQTQAVDIEAIVSAVERAHELPFHQGNVPVKKRAAKPERRPMAPEGDPVTTDEIGLLTARVAALKPEARKWCARIQQQAHARSRPIKLTGELGVNTARRYSIMRAVMTVAPYTDDELAAHLISHVTGEPAPTDLGDGFGSLTIPEADHLTRLVEALDAGHLTLLYEPIRLVGDIDAAHAA